ncbi:sensor histidine kinase [Streptosporangium subroseum]|uniref:sensor histidine kinase n=1 Tax=Streptosporangium subroseum TaxID=106412 RepID=UPI00308791E9|nr:nitrate- and nitrite sensing domain-containing protein [Streptosporangium subroseum]
MVGVVLAATRVVSSIDSVAGYQRTAAAADYSGGLRDLAQALGLERDRVAWSLFQPSNKGLKDSADEQKKTVDAIVNRVRLQLQGIDESYGPRVAKAAKDVTYQLAGLPELRKVTGTAQVERYNQMVSPLLQLHEELTLVSDDSEIIGNTRALSALAHAKEEISQQRARLLAGYYAPTLINAQELEKFIASRSRMQEYEADFSVEASPDNGQLFVNAMQDEKVYRAELTKSRAIVLGSDKQHTGRLISDFNAVKQWFSDNGTTIDRIKKVETQVAGDVVTRARELEDTEQRNAILTAGLILVLLLLVLGLTVLIARSMVQPLRRLRVEALDVAGFRLPEVVRRLRVSGETQTPDIAPISVDTKDEIGEVAKAFDEVHRQAVRLAAEESELRSNISAMFVNLSRRTQTLVERQISLIDGLEKGEEDGGRLSDLFKLDHLATRMRRNSENLLVLAGHEPTRRRSQPAKLVDVVRASLSEVEDYERVQVKVHRAISVAGSTANDIVHLVAELVENAIQFSPRASQVVVSSSMIEGGGALLAVSDVGIGMTNEELVETNRRLADPPVVDVSVSRRMGLFVVGRLALRHGIRVQLRPQEVGGLVAMVLLPPELMVEMVQPTQTPSWGVNPPPQQSSYGQASFGQTSFGQTSVPRDPSYGDSSFGQPAAPRSLFGETPAQRSPAYGESSFGEAPAPRAPFGEPPAPRTPFGEPPAPRGSSYGESSFGETPASRIPFDETSVSPGYGEPSFGRAPGAADPQTPPYGSTSLSDDHSAFGRQGFPAPSLGAPVTGEFALPRRPAQDTNGNGTTPPTGFPSWGEASYDDAETSSMPAVGYSPLEAEPEEFLPIFASIESAWFRRADDESEREAVVEEPAQGAATPFPGPLDSPAGSGPATGVPFAEPIQGTTGSPVREPVAEPIHESLREPIRGSAREGVPVREPGNWQTPADAGWQAAQAASEPALGGVTAAGLPKRTPRANLVPGVAASVLPSTTPMPPISADRVRSRLSSFQQGVRRGRAEVDEDATGNPGVKEEGS